MTLMSFHGQGFQHIMIIMLILLNNARQVPIYFLVMNLHIVLMLLGRSLYKPFLLAKPETLPKKDFSVQ
jgi:hypothetical protein